MVALFAIMRSNWLVLIIWTLLGGAVAGGINMLLPVVYEASAKILVSAPYWNDSTAIADPNFGGRILAYGDEFTQQRMASYARLVATPLVTGPVDERLKLGYSSDELAKKVTSHIIPDTVVLQIEARDASPTRAALIADATAEQTINVIKEMERPPYTLVSPVQPVLIEPATVPSRPISPRAVLNIVCGLVLGLLVGLTYVAVREARRLARLGGTGAGPGELGGVLGVLSANEKKPEDDLDDEARFMRLEVAHQLTQNGARSLLMTSPRSGPNTTVAASLLATMMEDVGASTIVVLADFSRADDSEPAFGLGDLLSRHFSLDSAIVSDRHSGVSWIPAGTAPANPTRALTGAKMRDILSELSRRYRHVVVVGPAVLESTDAVDLASQLDASILVNPVPQTSTEELRESERLLRLAKGAYLGRVVFAGREFSRQSMLI